MGFPAPFRNDELGRLLVQEEDRGADVPARDAMLPVERTRAGPFLQVDHSEGTAVVEPLYIERCPCVSANNQLR